jgi:hypothetical protein
MEARSRAARPGIISSRHTRPAGLLPRTANPLADGPLEAVLPSSTPGIFSQSHTFATDKDSVSPYLFFCGVETDSQCPDFRAWIGLTGCFCGQVKPFDLTGSPIDTDGRTLLLMGQSKKRSR